MGTPAQVAVVQTKRAVGIGERVAIDGTPDIPPTRAALRPAIYEGWRPSTGRWVYAGPGKRTWIGD